MPTFHIPEALADSRFTAGGREYTFDGTELTVEEEADAKRVRTFAYDYPQIGITEDGEIVAKPAEAKGEIVPESTNEDPAPAAEAAEAEAVEAEPEPEPDAPEAPSAEDDKPRKRGRRAE